MAQALLSIRERGTTVWAFHNGTYSSEDAALEEGIRMATEGSVEEFRIWSLSASYMRHMTVRRTDDAPE